MSSKPPIVESPPDGPAVPVNSERRAGLRIRQQEILAELGVAALKGTPFPTLIHQATAFAAEGLQAELAKVLEYVPSESRLLMRAGIGWDPGLVGVASVGADLQSPSGYALRTGKPVISNHLENEERFRTPELLETHGVRRAMNVILQGDGAPYGILEVDSRSEGEFSEHDIAFLQGAANILGMAIERQRHEKKLKDALEHQQVLVKEINHRVKNSLQLVASMLSLQVSDNPLVKRQLNDAATRISAIARAHDRLYRTPEIQRIDLGGYLGEVCIDLAQMSPAFPIIAETENGLMLDTDRAIRIALLVSELVTNASKYAYPQGGGTIRVGVKREGNAARISVSDQGIGLPASFAFGASAGFGMRLAQALAQQTDADVRFERLSPGTRITIELPLTVRH